MTRALVLSACLLLPASLVAQTIEHNGSHYQTPTAHSTPWRPEAQRVLGMKLVQNGGQLEVGRALPLAPAHRAGLRRGDRIVAVGGTAVADLEGFSQAVATSPGRVVDLHIERGARTLDLAVYPWDLGGLSIRTRGRFRLAVIPVCFPDQPPAALHTRDALQAQFFSRDSYREDPFGKRAYGSVADYYDENSAGRFALEGEVFDWVEVPSTWQENAGSTAFLASTFQGYMHEAIEALQADHGDDVLDRFDAVTFVTAGNRGPRGGTLWPHASGLWHDGRLLRYYTAALNIRSLEPIGVHCHEFGHVLGLLDKYGSAHATGLGVFCSMAIGHRGGGLSGEARPFHLCAYCKLRLGWLDAELLDPSQAQDRALQAIEGSAQQAFLIPKSADGDEFFLLENRQRVGFDTEFPETGLLIWHVGEPLRQLRSLQFSYSIDLEEAHGQGGPTGSHVNLRGVPFPFGENQGFGPHTAPSSNTLGGSGNLVSLSGIERVEQAIVFHLGPDVLADAVQPATSLRDEAADVARLWLAGLIDSLREQISLRRVDQPDNEGLQGLEARLRTLTHQLSENEPIDIAETARDLVQQLRKALQP